MIHAAAHTCGRPWLRGSSFSFRLWIQAAARARTLTPSAARVCAQVPLGEACGVYLQPPQLAPREQVRRHGSNSRPWSRGSSFSFRLWIQAATCARTLTHSAVRVRVQVLFGGLLGGSVGVQLAPHEQVHRRESNSCPRSVGGFSFVFAFGCGCLACAHAHVQRCTCECAGAARRVDRRVGGRAFTASARPARAGASSRVEQLPTVSRRFLVRFRVGCGCLAWAHAHVQRGTCGCAGAARRVDRRVGWRAFTASAQ